MKKIPRILAILALIFSAREAHSAPEKTPDPLAWPPITKQAKPWTRWWWMGSAVNKADLTRELTRLRDAGLGGVEITPIYGVHGAEEKFIDYLSPQWMDMLAHTVTEANRLGMGVDMATGTGWCFGGPNVSDADANATAIPKKNADGTFTITQKPSGVKVKRPAPGGAGWMLNLLYPDAMDRYLQRFTDAFAKYDGPQLHGQFHDSYEYKSDWSPDFLEQFKKRRGYDLTPELGALFENAGDPDHVARVKSDYRETVSDLIEESVARWTKWSHDHGFVSREQAHGSPGNWLDIYAAADIPETEMFYKDRDILVSKFASSAAHVTGKNLVGAETGTWVAEHFTETLADLKYLADDMFLAGVNRITWHGTAYSPDDAPWPGWCFYASTEMNPRNAIWRDVSALNAYIARVQSVLQSGRPDNDILLYWPIHDFWHNADGLVQPMTVHARDWFDGQPIGKVARMLWQRGYSFDYISDKQLNARRSNLITRMLFENKLIVVPECGHMPLETLRQLLSLANEGFQVIFVDRFPRDVQGFGNLENQRSEFKKLIEVAERHSDLLLGDLEKRLQQSHVRREPIADHPGIQFIRRIVDGKRIYFIANRGTKRVDDWITLNTKARFIWVYDPLTGKIGDSIDVRINSERTRQIHLQLDAGQSVILREMDALPANMFGWKCWQPAGDPIALTGNWNVKFISGGPVLPKEFSTEKLASWTELGGDDVKSFAGTARYTLTFDAPDSSTFRRGGGGESRRPEDGRANPTSTFLLDLGKVVQSARVRLNGSDLGTLIIPPFRVAVVHLKPKGNVLEVEVTGTSANRIRDLDVRKVPWKIFYDTNIVNLNYKPFDASQWPLADEGLLGPVTLTPQKESSAAK
jgi:hypothetical protein